jgi:thioesterase domain-containing protein
MALSRALQNTHGLVPIMPSHEELMALGSSVTMSHIASICANRILARHRHGPIYLGGFCSGGILAYETSLQLQKAGKDVSLVIMVDSPGPGSFGNIHLFGPTVNSPVYLFRRLAKIGARNAVLKVRKRIYDRIGYLRDAGSGAKRRDRQIDEMMRSALRSYEPPAYDGQLLLLLASDHAPHVNLMQEWNWLISENFRTQYVPGHHDELMEATHAGPVADAIRSMLERLETDYCKRALRSSFQCGAIVRRPQSNALGERPKLSYVL